MVAKGNVTSFIEVRDMCMFILMFFLLMRESEVTALRLEDVVVSDFEGKKITFGSFEPTKTDQGRKGDCVVVEQSDEIRLCPISWYFLYLELRGKHKSPFLFVRVDESKSR